MKKVNYIVEAIVFLLVWFGVAVIVDLIMFVSFPPAKIVGIYDRRILAGVILGLLAGIQSFRMSVRESNTKGGKIDRIMRTIRNLIVVVACLFLLILLIGPFSIFNLRIQYSFDHLEQNARKVITGSELQAWAVQILAQYPTPTNGQMDLRLSDLAAPLPKPLLGLYHRPPDIFVYETTTNDPGHVRLNWGGGLIGHCGFEIGPTNFVGMGHPWQDGVYFWSEFDHK